MRQHDQGTNEHPEAVRSVPVPVPPPSDETERSRLPEDAVDGRGTFDDPAANRHTDPDRNDADVDPDRDGRNDRDLDLDRDDADVERTRAHDVRQDADGDGRPEFHEPGPVPTAFGASTVGGAVAASALASPLPQDEPDPRLESTARPGDGAVDGDREGRRADPTAEFHHGTQDADEDGRLDRDDHGRIDGDDHGHLDRDDAVSPELDDPARAGTTGQDGAVVGALGAEATARPTDSTVAGSAATLFDAETAQGFRDRWRDVQLRFVDDPRAATGEAQSLVDEAIQALASALAAQKSKLGGWQDAGSADTEQLRMAVRQYRDFLDRVLGR